MAERAASPARSLISQVEPGSNWPNRTLPLYNEKFDPCWRRSLCASRGRMRFPPVRCLDDRRSPTIEGVALSEHMPSLDSPGARAAERSDSAVDSLTREVRRFSAIAARKFPPAGFTFRFKLGGLLLLSLLSLVGCGGGEAVQTREVPKPRRILATLLVDQAHETAWLIELSGPTSLLDRNQQDFESFVNSFRVSADGGLATWDVPTHWRQVVAEQAGVQAEYSVTPRIVGADDAGSDEKVDSIELDLESFGADASSLGADSEEAAEQVTPALPYDLYRVRVRKLSLPSTIDLEAYRLTNVNRWRRAVDLAPIELPELATETEARTVGDLPATWVDYYGRVPDGADSNRIGAAAPASPESPLRAGIKFELPEGWSEPPTGAPLASLTLEKDDGNAKGQITVSLMNAQVPWTLQAARWAGQVGLSLSDEELTERTSQTLVAGLPSERIDLASSEPEAPDAQRVIAIRAVAGNAAWFIRVKGRPAFVEAELESFNRFIESLELPSAE